MTRRRSSRGWSGTRAASSRAPGATASRRFAGSSGRPAGCFAGWTSRRTCSERGSPAWATGSSSSRGSPAAPSSTTSATLRLLREFRYEGEGWGLAYDGASLIQSDGTNVLTYRDPESFTLKRRLAVTWNGQPLQNLNELEFIEGAVWANVWYTDFIVQISPESGQVTSYLDLTGLRGPDSGRHPDAVLNGIAYDPTTRRLFVTGKLWPAIFEIRVR